MHRIFCVYLFSLFEEIARILFHNLRLLHGMSFTTYSTSSAFRQLIAQRVEQLNFSNYPNIKRDQLISPEKAVCIQKCFHFLFEISTTFISQRSFGSNKRVSSFCVSSLRKHIRTSWGIVKGGIKRIYRINIYYFLL